MLARTRGELYTEQPACGVAVPMHITAGNCCWSALEPGRVAAPSAQAFGIVVDDPKNDATVGGKAAEIQADNSRVKILVIPTDEELSIAQQVGRPHV